MKRVGGAITALALVAALAAPAAANCLARSQLSVGETLAENAYSISAFGWQGDRAYDQVVPACGSHPGFVEFGCNAAAFSAIVLGEDATNRDTAKHERALCVLNYLGAIAFSAYTRVATNRQIVQPVLHRLGIRFSIRL